jgi:hypothetical protein
MKRILFTMLLAASLSAEAQTQTYETEFARPLNEVLTDIQNRFGVRLKYDIDTVGKVLSYADFRIRLIPWKNPLRMYWHLSIINLLSRKEICIS